MKLTVGQYRNIIANIHFWESGLLNAMNDSGIPQTLLQEVIDYLYSRGWEYDQVLDTLKYAI